MSDEKLTFQGFMKENAIAKSYIEYAASKRFVDADNQPLVWKLRPLTNKEMDALTEKNTKRVQIKGTRDFKKELDQVQFMMDMTVKSVVYPNLDDETLQTSYDAVGAEDLLKEMLTPGELADLQFAVNEASDFNVGMNDKIKQAKN